MRGPRALMETRSLPSYRNHKGLDREQFFSPWESLVINMSFNTFAELEFTT